MPEWTAWQKGDEMPPPGPYWVTCPDVGGGMFSAKELLHGNLYGWRYSGVVAYMPRIDGEDRPPVYEGSNGAD